jgi:hypothetical protein
MRSRNDGSRRKWTFSKVLKVYTEGLFLLDKNVD